MRTTININDALISELRRKAAESGRPFRQVLEETLQRGLAAKPGSRRPAHVPTFPVGVKAAYRGVSMNQLYDQLEAEEHLRVAER